MPVDGFATDGASDSMATFGVQHLCTTSLLPPALSPVASSPNSLRDTNGARLPRMENGLDIHHVRVLFGTSIFPFQLLYDVQWTAPPLMRSSPSRCLARYLVPIFELLCALNCCALILAEVF